MTENNNLSKLANLSLSSIPPVLQELKTLLNIAIGARIKLLNFDIVYIFYGYNYNQTLISCFPINSSNVVDNMIYVPIEQIETIL